MDVNAPSLNRPSIRSRASSRFSPAYARWSIVVVSVLILELIGQAHVVNTTVFVPPSEMLLALLSAIQAGSIWANLLRTAIEITLSFSAASVIGLGLSFLFWKKPTLGRIVEPFLVGSQAVPTILLYPVLLVLFGLGLWPIVVTATMTAMVPVVLNGWIGLTQIRDVYLKIATSFSCPRWPLYAKVIVPAAAPMLFAGLKMGFVYATIGVVAMEFLIADAGLGWLVKYNYDIFRTAPLYGYILLVLVIAYLSNSALLDAERRIRQGASGGTTQSSQIQVSRTKMTVGVLTVIAAGLLVWQGLSGLFSFVISPPLASVEILVGGFTQGWILPHLVATLTAVGSAVAIAVVLGALAGLALGTNAYWGASIEPLLLGGNAVPKIVLFPVFLLFFGLGISAKIAVGAVHGFFPVTINAMAAARELDPVHVKVGRSLNATRWQMLTKIYLPSIVLPLVAGMRMAFSLSIIGVTMAELFASREGLGLLVRRAYGMMQWPQMFAIILFLFLVSFAGNGLFWLLERQLRSGR